MMTDEQLAKIRARFEAATYPDAPFCEGCRAVDDICDLLDEVDRLTAELDDSKAERAHYGDAMTSKLGAAEAEVARLAAEIEKLRDCEAVVNIARGLPLLTDDRSHTAALAYTRGGWEVFTLSESFWAGPIGSGETPEQALVGALEEMLEACDAD